MQGTLPRPLATGPSARVNPRTHRRVRGPPCQSRDSERERERERESVIPAPLDVVPQAPLLPALHELRSPTVPALHAPHSPTPPPLRRQAVTVTSLLPMPGPQLGMPGAGGRHRGRLGLVLALRPRREGASCLGTRWHPRGHLLGTRLLESPVECTRGCRGLGWQGVAERGMPRSLRMSAITTP